MDAAAAAAAAAAAKTSRGVVFDTLIPFNRNDLPQCCNSWNILTFPNVCQNV